MYERSIFKNIYIHTRTLTYIPNIYIYIYIIYIDILQVQTIYIYIYIYHIYIDMYTTPINMYRR